MAEDFFIAEENNEKADRDADIGDIENRPGVESSAEESKVGNIEMEEINDLTVEEGCIIEDNSIENSVNKVTESTSENKSESNSKEFTFIPVNKNEINNNNGSGNSK
jgi:hypothetical protein